MRTVILFRTLFVTLLTMLSTASFSQTMRFQSAKEKNANKPSLFTNDSAVSKLQPTFINQLSIAERHDIVSLRITHNTKFEGIVLRVDKTDKLVSITVKSLEVDNLTLIFSDRIDETGEHVYRAILMGNKYKDVLILENNHWYKKEMSDLIQD